MREKTKQFLKPDWRKLALTVLILLPVIGCAYSDAGAFWLFPVGMIFSFPAEMLATGLCEGTLCEWLMILLTYYLISYLMIYIYDKFKTRIKK